MASDFLLIVMPSEDTQFSKASLPARAGLPANEKEVATKPVSFRPYIEDVKGLSEQVDRAGFIRDAVHSALEKESS